MIGKAPLWSADDSLSSADDSLSSSAEGLGPYITGLPYVMACDEGRDM